MKQDSVADVFAENNRRNKLYFRDYSREHGDPDGETTPRGKIKIEGTTLYLPKSMLEIPFIQALGKTGSYDVLLAQTKGICDPKEVEKLKKEFIDLRFEHDFEFWAVTCDKIQDKLTKKYIKLRLNRGQRRLVASFEKQRLAGVPIRVILVKARQWGGSTATQMYMLWLQLFHYYNWHSAIVSQLKAQSANVRNMIVRTIKEYPNINNKPTIKTVPGTQNIKYIVERGCQIQVGSAEKPDAIRSFDIAMCHMTELAFWASTKTKSGDDLIQSLYAAIPEMPGTFMVMESTAKGVGNFFHEQWLAATTQGSQYQPVFVPWFEIEMYTKPISNYTKFIETMSAYEWWQWRQGATLEGINWYRWYKKIKTYSDFRMKSEFPTTADEAFQSSAGAYFTEDIIERARKDCREPIWMGDIRGNSFKGANALKGIKLYEKELDENMLKIWIHPEEEKDEKMLHQFVVIVDIGGKSYKSDDSVISVFDRSALMSPFGALERAAIWVGHIDHDLLAWKAAQIAEYYNHALLVIEKNTLVKEVAQNTIINEGDHVYTVIDELADHYDNLYAYVSNPDKVLDNGKPTTYGWSMNKKSKYQAYDRYTAALRDYEYIERSHDAVNEMQWLRNNRGLIEAAVGKKDDIPDTTAIGVFIAFEEMPPPKIVPIHKAPPPQIRQKKSVGAAGF